MKKWNCLFLAILTLAFCLCGCQRGNIQNGDASSAPLDNSGEYGVTLSLREKLIVEIDGAYAEEEKSPESSTTAGMVALAEKYADQWRQVADTYYNKLMEYDGIDPPNDYYYTSDDFHTFVSNMKADWEQYYRVQCGNYLNTMQAIYTSGTIVGPIVARYEYEMQREWALQLVGIYQQLYIE